MITKEQILQKNTVKENVELVLDTIKNYVSDNEYRVFHGNTQLVKVQLKDVDPTLISWNKRN